MLVIFSAAVVSALWRGLDISCGCYTQDPAAERLGWWKVGENTVLAVFAFLVFRHPRTVLTIRQVLCSSGPASDRRQMTCSGALAPGRTGVCATSVVADVGTRLERPCQIGFDQPFRCFDRSTHRNPDALMGKQILCPLSHTSCDDQRGTPLRKPRVAGVPVGAGGSTILARLRSRSSADQHQSEQRSHNVQSAWRACRPPGGSRFSCVCSSISDSASFSPHHRPMTDDMVERRLRDAGPVHRAIRQSAACASGAAHGAPSRRLR